MPRLCDEFPARIRIVKFGRDPVHELCQNAGLRFGLGSSQGLLGQQQVQFGLRSPLAGTYGIVAGGIADETVCWARKGHIAEVRHRRCERVLDFRSGSWASPFKRPVTTVVNSMLPMSTTIQGKPSLVWESRAYPAAHLARFSVWKVAVGLHVVVIHLVGMSNTAP